LLAGAWFAPDRRTHLEARHKAYKPRLSSNYLDVLDISIRPSTIHHETLVVPSQSPVIVLTMKMPAYRPQHSSSAVNDS
jgi:hypothetical protein